LRHVALDIWPGRQEGSCWTCDNIEECLLVSPLKLGGARGKGESPRASARHRTMTFRIGIISDTHGLLRPEAERLLEGVDHIVHGGDIGRPEIVAALRRIAPLTAIRGNVDTGGWARDYAETGRVRLAERSIFVLHDLNALRIDPLAVGIDVIVSGHSHVPKIDTVDGVLYLNPGSAGPRRFKLPITLATLDVTADGLRPVIHELQVG
jgi:uncharacterized protein